MYYICDFFKYSTVKLKMETKYYSTLFPILCLEKKRSLTHNDVIPCSIFKMISCQKLTRNGAIPWKTQTAKTH